MSKTEQATTTDAAAAALAWVQAFRRNELPVDSPHFHLADAAAHIEALAADAAQLRTRLAVECGRADVLAGDYPALRRRTDGSWTYEDADEREHYGATWREAVDAYITSADTD